MKRGVYSDRSYDGDILDRFREELMCDIEERLERQKLGRRRYPRRDLNRLRGEIHNELRAMRAIDNRLRNSRESPEARAFLSELMDEAADQGLTVDDLYRAFPGRPSLTGRLSDFLQSRSGMLLMLALLAVLATPAAREALKPALKKLVEEVNELTEQARGFLSKVREGVEDIVAEARFDKIKDEMEKVVQEDFRGAPGPETN